MSGNFRRKIARHQFWDCPPHTASTAVLLLPGVVLAYYVKNCYKMAGLGVLSSIVQEMRATASLLLEN